MTDFTDKVNILGTFYSDYRDDEELLDFLILMTLVCHLLI